MIVRARSAITHIRKSALALLPLLLLWSGLTCANATAAGTDVNEQHVVLMSLDGFRHDYIEKHDASSLAAMAKNGVRAERLTPVYPANTFPNHLSIVTGLRPVNHGIVNNDFYDKRRPDGDGYAHYSMGKGRQDSTWIHALPFWNLVEFHGKKAATFFWPESDARINGALPTYHYAYSKYADYQQRVDQIVSWLSLPDAQRPRFVAGYFSLVDSVGHDAGPDAQETRDAVRQVDALIGQLQRRLAALPVAVNLIIVSDHGMTELNPDAVIGRDSLAINNSAFIAENNDAQMMLYAKPGTDAKTIAWQADVLKETSQGAYRVLSPSQREQRHFSQGPRTGDIILEAIPPARFTDADNTYTSLGGHGYPPQHPDMGGLFVATGPAFKQGATLPPVSNLEVYPAMAEILGLPLLSEIDGEVSVLREGLTAEQ
ncbi:alkaline phosphatase family protein [Alteromonas halophila]|uniref:Alkaline phosphatase family protein n=1 Tax=Alteromonas halophila TaxID=516698 RepID=A0A918MWS4_9ALTE|nr:alkaline phosphatase family protein [Alteromonas halophila]